MNNKKAKIIIFIIILLLFNPILYITSPAKNSSESKNIESKFFQFNSYIELYVDTSVLDKPISLYQAISVPINIEYSTDIPSNFLWFAPWQIRNLLLFGTVIQPMQKIDLSLNNIPEWGQFYITTPSLMIDVPIGNESKELKTNLIILLDEKAPAELYPLEISASCDRISRLNGGTWELTIPLTPQFLPCIEIECKDHTIKTPPLQATHVQINITNCGNYISRVTPTLINFPQNLTPTINPPMLSVEKNTTLSFTLSVYPSSNFSGFYGVQIDFKTERFPFMDGTPNSTQSFYLLIYYP
jgi:hypothetical protein